MKKTGQANARTERPPNSPETVICGPDVATPLTVLQAAYRRDATGSGPRAESPGVTELPRQRSTTTDPRSGIRRSRPRLTSAAKAAVPTQRSTGLRLRYIRPYRTIQHTTRTPIRPYRRGDQK